MSESAITRDSVFLKMALLSLSTQDLYYETIPILSSRLELNGFHFYSHFVEK